MNCVWRKIAGEAIGTAFLLAAVVGSGVMAEKLAAGNIALALLANAIATGAALVALIIAFYSVSGAHMNPVVTLMMATQKEMTWNMAALYVAAQLAGAFAGVLAAHLMFGLPLIQTSVRTRNGLAQSFSEFVATFGLLIVIQGATRTKSPYVPFAVGAYITAAYWFTSSTSFANPAVTLARTVTNTFSGIRPQDAPSFIAAQLVACAAAAIFSAQLFPNKPSL